jgi:putative protease
MQKPELLMPAGSLSKMEYAYAYGADAVYLGVPYFSLRARENEFNLESLYKAKELAVKNNKKLYLTVNIFSKNRKLNSFEDQISEWVQLKPDAFIMSDPGLMMMAKEKFPDINLHLSVQANCMNWQTVRFWKQSLGVSRIILSRELHLNEVKEIKQKVPEMELEAFVHGSICIAYSGRCLMSSYMSHRDANQGVCDNSCREKFKVYAADPEPKAQEYVLEDMRSPGTLYPISEDENGTYLMNAKDLCLIEHLREIMEAGVCSFKIEGRTKSLNYVALISQAYRKAIDDMWENKPFDKTLLADLEKVANRGYSTGFMVQEKPGAEAQNYNTSVSRNFSQRFAGILNKEPKSPEGFISVEVRNKIVKGQDCEVIFPNHKIQDFKVTDILDKNLNPTDSAHGGAGTYYFKTNFTTPPDFGLLSLKMSSEEYHNQL